MRDAVQASPLRASPHDLDLALPRRQARRMTDRRKADRRAHSRGMLAPSLTLAIVLLAYWLFLCLTLIGCMGGVSLTSPSPLTSSPQTSEEPPPQDCEAIDTSTFGGWAAKE